MFSICPKKVYKNKDLSSVDIRVYLSIQGFANEDGFCFPSVSRIADECGISRRSVFRSLSKLEACRVIAREKRLRDDGGYSSNGYYLRLEPDSPVANLSQGNAPSESLHSDTDGISNNNHLNKNINLNFIKQRARVRANSQTNNKVAPVVDMMDVNDILSCYEAVKQAKNYNFFKTGRGCLGFRPLSASMRDAITEAEIKNFFNDKCNREIIAYDYNTHGLNEVNIQF
ncbi:MAG: helix-turn-helix domain-containing protein [Alphaproteobacteria bacterium]|nr:helix-turn-helix domain-containing protein [Alphaproteobacteria bacterium]